MPTKGTPSIRFGKVEKLIGEYRTVIEQIKAAIQNGTAGADAPIVINLFEGVVLDLESLRPGARGVEE